MAFGGAEIVVFLALLGVLVLVVVIVVGIVLLVGKKGRGDD